jgi:isochorismate hydrolase
MSSKDASVLRFARPVSPPRLVSFEAEPQRAEIDLARTALFVVDMQNDFLHPDGWFPRLGFDPAPLAAVIPKLIELTGKARDAGVR